MYLLWFLPAILPAVPLFTIWRIRQLQPRELCKRKQSVIQPSIPDRAVPKSIGAPARQVKWISIDELMTVPTECRDLIVADLRADATPVPFPVSTALVLPVSPNELDMALELLPADRSISICGASNFSNFVPLKNPCMRGSAPLCALEGDLRLAEAS
jgi:hypothetical protein